MGCPTPRLDRKKQKKNIVTAAFLCAWTTKTPKETAKAVRKQYFNVNQSNVYFLPQRPI